MTQNSRPFTIPDIRNFIPEKVKPWIIIAFVLVYQLSGGIYLASVSEMKGTLSLMQEDIMMAGYASLVGLALTFTVMFRLKFRFPLKNSLIITAVGLIISNLICIHTNSLPILVITCFFAGFFRMWGTFACNTTIQLWVTPKRDMSVWFCYIYLLVNSCLQFSGISTVYVAYLSKWEYMQWIVILLLICLIFITFIIFRHYRSMKKLPLFGIDWIGMILWAITILCIIFVLNYGDYYDWYQSIYIIIGTVFGILSLILNLWRASFIRHPFIALKTWTYRNVWLTFGLYIIISILLSPSHYFEHIYTEIILGYDSLNAISLNWAMILGIFFGTAISYKFFALGKATFKTMTLIGIMFIISYLFVMYNIIDFNLSKEILLIPIFLRGVGYIIIAITFITALTVIPFQHFPQTLTIQAFVSACLGSLIGNAVLNQIFKLTLKKNIMLLGANLDNINPIVNKIPSTELFGKLQFQAMMVSMKEIYGLLLIFGLIFLMVLFLKESTLRPKALHPKFYTIRRAAKHEIKMTKLHKNIDD
ncbi:MAG: hypothetical protein H6Q16_135 [Bacteroidetes bacterium]|nr:hypothetical protein [Bacteroidota bacterium]